RGLVRLLGGGVLDGLKLRLHAPHVLLRRLELLLHLLLIEDLDLYVLLVVLDLLIELLDLVLQQRDLDVGLLRAARVLLLDLTVISVQLLLRSRLLLQRLARLLQIFFQLVYAKVGPARSAALSLLRSTVGLLHLVGLLRQLALQ